MTVPPCRLSHHHFYRAPRQKRVMLEIPQVAVVVVEDEKEERGDVWWRGGEWG